MASSKAVTFLNHLAGPAWSQNPITSLGCAATSPKSSLMTDMAAGPFKRGSGGGAIVGVTPTQPLGALCPWSEPMKTKITTAIAALLLAGTSTAALAQDHDRDHGGRGQAQAQPQAQPQPQPRGPAPGAAPQGHWDGGGRGGGHEGPRGEGPRGEGF